MTHTLMPSGVCQSLSGYENDIAANSEISLYDPYFNAKWCVSVLKCGAGTWSINCKWIGLVYKLSASNAILLVNKLLGWSISCQENPNTYFVNCQISQWENMLMTVGVGWFKSCHIKNLIQ